MTPPAFEYHAPATAEDAVALLADLGDAAKLIGGGQSLVPMLALRLAVFDHLIDLRHVSELRGITASTDSVRIGALTTHPEVGASEEVRRAIPLLAQATPLIGDLQIRTLGTIGGAIAHADGAAEYPAVALTLDAQIETLSPRGRRTIPASEFFTGMWATDLDIDEIVTAITFPVWHGHCGFAIEEFSRRSGDFAMAGATVALRLDENSRIDHCAVGLFGLTPQPMRAQVLQAAPTGRPIHAVAAEAVGAAATAGLHSLPSDVNGSAAYRRRMGAEMVERAWRRAVQEASID
ncbi:xanthine dehydrogenase family protein subunit M [Nocardia sp. NPDC006630]|uniref:FAD binding domain-containing protein n=1 Tax=Nocardia sp. NPDC006630 TaxID=3157181 RepID=UPI00339DBA0F